MIHFLGKYMIYASLDGIKSNNTLMIFYGNNNQPPFFSFTLKRSQKIGCSSIKSPEDGAIELQEKLRRSTVAPFHSTGCHKLSTGATTDIV